MIVKAALSVMWMAYTTIHPGATLIPSPPQTAPEAPRRAPEVQEVSGGIWDRLAACESGGDWRADTGNGYFGGLQFALGSWRGVGGQGLPSNASKAEQIARAEKLRRTPPHWGHWPVCSRVIGAR